MFSRHSAVSSWTHKLVFAQIRLSAGTKGVAAAESEAIQFRQNAVDCFFGRTYSVNND